MASGGDGDGASSEESAAEGEDIAGRDQDGFRPGLDDPLPNEFGDMALTEETCDFTPACGTFVL